MATTDKPGLLAQLARRMAAGDGPLESRLCKAYLAILGGDGAALTLAYDRPERVTLCSTDEVSSRLDDLQDVLGEGPSTEAFRTGELTIADLHEARQPWPLFADAARKAVGALVMYALPMRPHREVLGVLTVYHRVEVDLMDRGAAEFLTDAIGAALLRDPAPSRGDFRTGPWSTRAGVHQAAGMIVAQLGISPDDAMALLRAHAFAHDSSLAAVAEQILTRSLVFTDHDTAGDENR
jgi:ANTAR domain-containing protein